MPDRPGRSLVVQPLPLVVDKLLSAYPGLSPEQANEIALRLQEIIVEGIGPGRVLAVGRVVTDGAIDLDVYTIEKLLSDQLRHRPKDA